MTLAQEFNSLNGIIVTRKDLEKLLEKAEKEKHTIISKRIIKVLHAFADDTFLIELQNLVEPFGLNGVDTDDVAGLLGGLEFISESEDVGLGKSVSPNDIYDMVTQKMIDLIKDANRGDYKKAWKEEGYLIPYNFVSKKAYRGVNTIMLSPIFGLLDNPYFLTFNQIQEKGGKLKKGSHGHKVVYYSTFKKEYSDSEIEKINTVTKGEKIEKGDEKTTFFLKYYNVFNGADIEGIDFDLDNFSLQGKVVDNEIEVENNEKIEIAESIIENYPKIQPKINFNGSKASYVPKEDIVKMPAISKFKTSQDFYRTLFHELSHSTGHESRLNRPFKNPFGTPEYAFEELIAEFGAVFLSAQAGIMYYTNKNHASYLKGWNEVLLPNLESDNRFLMKASSQAQKLCDFILQPNAKGDFLFMKVNTKKAPVKKLKTVKKEVVKSVKKQSQLSLFEGLAGTASNKETIAFNKQIIEAKRNGFTPRTKFYLGETKGELLKIVGVSKIILLGAIVKKAMLGNDKSHVVQWEHLINLPDNINKPVAIFKSEKTKDGFVVLTEVKSHLEKPFMVAVHLNNTNNTSEIRSVYSRTSLTHYKNWHKKGLLLFGNKKSEMFRRVFSGIIPDALNKSPLGNKDTTKGLNAPKTIQKKTESQNLPSKIQGNENKNSLAYKMANKPKDVPTFKIEDTDIAEFLGDVERKNKESVVISLAGGQGSMKTRMAFQFMNALGQNYKVAHASIEEHPESNLYFDKAEQYLNTKALNNIEAPEIKSVQDLDQLIKKNDVIVIDSFTKMQEMQKGFEVDKDLRKKYDGKLFIVIFQQTTEGKMRGGAKSQFDADIVLFTEKKDDYRDNYIYADKNRYQNKPLDGLKFNIFNKKIVQNIPEVQTNLTAKKELSFKVN